jgi:hypothetical protein
MNTDYINETLLDLFNKNDTLELSGYFRDSDRGRDRDRDRDRGHRLPYPSNFFNSHELILDDEIETTEFDSIPRQNI